MIVETLTDAYLTWLFNRLEFNGRPIKVIARYDISQSHRLTREKVEELCQTFYDNLGGKPFFEYLIHKSQGRIVPGAGGIERIGTDLARESMSRTYTFCTHRRLRTNKLSIARHNESLFVSSPPGYKLRPEYFDDPHIMDIHDGGFLDYLYTGEHLSREDGVMLLKAVPYHFCRVGRLDWKLVRNRVFIDLEYLHMDE